MLNVHHRYFPFRSHPIVNKFRLDLEADSADKIAQMLLKHNVVFFYPRVISFSFIPYPTSMLSYKLASSNTIPYDGYPVEEFIKKKLIIVPSEKHYYNFFVYLKQYIDKNKISPILVIDLRLANVLYTDLIIKLLELYKDNQFKLLFLSYRDIQKDLKLICKVEDDRIFVDSDSLFLHLDKLASDNTLTICLPDRISIANIGETFVNEEIEIKAKRSLVVSLNFDKSYSISTFACCLLCLYIRTFSPKIGIRWRFDNLNNIKLLEKFLRMRMFIINRFFLENIDYLGEKEKERQEFRSLGITIFDRTVRRDLTYSIDLFIRTVKKYFETYLTEKVSYKFQMQYSSYKPQIRSMPRFYFVQEFIHELIDNIFLHANSVGYIFMEISNYHLYIFIGDCGKGLKKGILQNYDIPKEISSDRDAIYKLFDLDKFNINRKKTEDYNGGAGTGLKMTLYNISLLKGKFIYRTGNAIGSFMNPVFTRGTKPSKVLDSYTNINGTQYCVIIPLSYSAIETLPKTTGEFLNLIER